MILLKVTTAKNAWFVTISFLIMNSSFKMLSANIIYIAIITTKNVDYCCIIYSISKSGAINLLKNSVLEVYSKHFLNFFLFSIDVYKS